MAGTITNDGFRQMLYYGFENYPVSVRILDGSDNVIDIQTTTLTKSGNTVQVNDIVLNVSSADAPITISKVTLFSDNETIWTYDVNYEFPAEGTLTFSLSMGLSGTQTVTNDGAEYILLNGLRNENLIQTIIGGSPISKTASFGDPVDNAISMTTSPVFSVPSGTTITGMDTTLSAPDPNILLSEIRNLSYVFSESGTLTLDDYTITLSNG